MEALDALQTEYLRLKADIAIALDRAEGELEVKLDAAASEKQTLLQKLMVSF
jgi:hypothetical protein